MIYKIGDLVRARHRIFSSFFREVYLDDIGIVIKCECDGENKGSSLYYAYKVYFFKQKFIITPFESQIKGFERLVRLEQK